MKFYLSAVLGFLIWGTFALVLKPLSNYGSLDILFYRVVFASISIIIACFLFRRKPTMASLTAIREMNRNGRFRLFFHVLISAILLALNWFLFILVMNTVSVNATSLAYLICPILTTVLANIFLKEHLNRGQWIAVALSVMSCILMAYGHFMDLFYSFLIALTYASYLVMQKNKFPIDRFFALTLHISLGCLMLLPLAFFIDTHAAKTDEFYILILVIAIGYTIVPLFLNNYALKGLDSSVVGILLYLNPIISFFLAILYYKESINLFQIIAFSCIFLAIVLFNASYLYERRRTRLIHS